MRSRLPAWAKRAGLGVVLSAAAFAAAVRWIPFPEDKLARLDSAPEGLRIRDVLPATTTVVLGPDGAGVPTDDTAVRPAGNAIPGR